MDESNTLSDAEMRPITINGQTIMLGGDFENMNMTNEFLNEMLMGANAKVDISDGCNVQLNATPCVNAVKETIDEPAKLEISIQEDVNELETIQIGVDEAKALGLYFYGFKNDGPDSWENCAVDGLEQAKEDEKVNGHPDPKVKLHSVPLLSVASLDKEQDLVSVNDKFEDAVDGSDYMLTSKVEKMSKAVQEESVDNLPAIGHLEGFQIPTPEDGVLLPATVNLRMADGSCQTITLVPQIINGTVTYPIHFSGAGDKNVNSCLNYKDHFSESLNVDFVGEEIINNVSSVDGFLHSVQSIKNEQVKNNFSDNVQRLSDKKTSVSPFPNSEESVLKVNKSNNLAITGNDVSVNYLVRNQLPIETKIDNLISENENVISKCKKVKYGKKVRDVESSLPMNKVSKSNITKAKKVKFKNKGIKFPNDEVEQKELKLSLLKTNKDDLNKKIVTNTKPNTSALPHMNLNGRLEYPNLKAIDETATQLSYLKVKTSHTTKQPYFNVLPYPKDKTIPIQKQFLPINCDVQQAKNLISLQKFLETQKLQLKIQPIVSNGNKIINIRPKPTSNQEVQSVNVTSNELCANDKDKVCAGEGEEEIQKVEEDESVKSSYQDKDVLSDGKLNCLKFLKSPSTECNGEVEKETNSDCSSKINGIFIKNNPEYFSPKIKDGKDEHPLGSSENPIQLVQTGHTFHSRQPLSETQLRQIASILQKQKFDSPNIKKNSIFDPKTNTRIVYRVVYPEDVELRDIDKGSSECITKRKRGRHKTKPVSTEDEVQKKPSPLPRGPGRPKKTPAVVLEDDVIEEEMEDTTPKKKIPRTRSGRLSRPPRYMVKDYKRLHNSDASEKISNSNYDSDEAFATYQNDKKVPVEPTENIPELELESNVLPDMRRQQRSKRNFKPEYRCPTCQKIYLGHTRMMWHLNKFPDHCNVEKYKENYYRKRTETKARRAARRLDLCDVTNKVKQVLNSMSKEELTSLCGPILAEALTIWDFLLLRVNLLKATRKDEVDALLHELVILLDKLTKIAEDIFLPVFTKEAEKDEDCVEIDRMEVAIALGLPVGFYKVNNDNLNLLRLPLKPPPEEPKETEEKKEEESSKVESEFPEKPQQDEEKHDLFPEKPDPWDDDKSTKKLEDPFWLESKVEDPESWHSPEVKTLSTKFEPNLSNKILESSNDSIDDSKYEEPVQLIDLDSNSKDIEQSNSSGNLDESPEINLVKDHPKISQMEKSQECGTEEKHSELWNENSTDKVTGELWSETTAARGKWDESADIVQTKSAPGLWTEGSEMPPASEKPPPNIWNENSNLTSSEKVDETNSEFLDSLLSVPNSNEFLANESGGFLSETLMNDKSERLKTGDAGAEAKEKEEWRNDEGENNYWETGKNPPWQKGESILSGGLQERMPGVRTASRLTSTPETNGNMSFSIPNRRNSISDFSNINLEPGNLDMVLPPAKTLIKDCLKDDEEKFEMKANVGDSFLQSSDKNWESDNAKPDFATSNVNSEELMKMALESLTSQHDVINVQASSFEGILNQTQETGNLNLFSSSETDGLDFNLPLPEHLLRSNFAPSNFQTTCAPNFPSSESPAFLSTTNNIFGTTCTNSMDQFDANYADKKSKSLDEVMDFFGSKNSFNGYENASETGNMNNFAFDSESRSEFAATVESQPAKKQGKVRGKKQATQKGTKVPKGGARKTKAKKTVDYLKPNTIESIINEALFDSCPSNTKSLQIENSSPNGSSTIPNRTDNYSLPIIPESLDEVENLDFLNQD